MKPCIILAFLLVGAIAVVAQQAPLSADVQQKLAELNRRYEPLRVQTPIATYSHTTGKGKVYTLTPDNMPCLVPDMKAVGRMPNRGGVILDDRMNAMPRQRIIPREDKKDKK